jgi:hypothetical protein
LLVSRSLLLLSRSLLLLIVGLSADAAGRSGQAPGAQGRRSVREAPWRSFSVRQHRTLHAGNVHAPLPLAVQVSLAQKG